MSNDQQRAKNRDYSKRYRERHHDEVRERERARDLERSAQRRTDKGRDATNAYARERYRVQREQNREAVAQLVARFEEPADWHDYVLGDNAAAELLGVDTNWLTRRRYAGDGPPFDTHLLRGSVKLTVFNRRQLLAWFESNAPRPRKYRSTVDDACTAALRRSAVPISDEMWRAIADRISQLRKDAK